MKEHVTTERLLNRTWKATLGTATGTGKSESAAVKACLADAVDILKNGKQVKLLVDRGYLVGSQIESSTSAWYFIKHLSELYSKDPLKRLIFPSTFMSPAGLYEAIERHLSQYIADAKADYVRTCPVCLCVLLNSARKDGNLYCANCKSLFECKHEDFTENQNGDRVCTKCKFPAPAESAE